MHISKIELENIKSHASSTFEFTRGTTAITGENGAGKTTIIEAIAWVLFDLLEYKKEDFVRRGEKKGAVRVTFESGLDERDYIVYRDTGAGYNVTDPRLKTRIADKKEEVFRFLWQHLGLEPGTDLKSLFRQAIGVPQGTFTAIFLEGATERKIAFDRLLKVEEYRQAAEKLRETSRYLDSQIGRIREGIARAEGELNRSESVAEEHKTVAEQAARLAVEIEKMTADLVLRQANVQKLGEQERTISDLKTLLERTRSETEKAEIVFAQSQRSLERAAEAASSIEAARPDHERHIAALARFPDLERERGERDRLQSEIAKTDAAMVSVKAEQKRLDQQLEAVSKARTEIENLRPKTGAQQELEKEIARLRDNITSARAAAERINSIQGSLERLRENFRVNQAAMREAEAKAAAAGNLLELEQRDATIINGLANLRASLERDEKFQSEIKNGLCPILSQKCLNLNEGETLETFVSSQFENYKSGISNLEIERRTVAADLKTAREAEKFSAALGSYRRHDAELKEEGKGLTEKKATLESQLSDAANSETLLAAAEARLISLDDPAARIRFLEKEILRENEIREGLSHVGSNLERLESERRLFVEQMDEYKEVDENWTRLTAERDATAGAHRIFLTNESDAKSLDFRQKESETAKNELAALAAKLDAADKGVNIAAAGYDPDLHNQGRAELLTAERRHAETRATFEASKGREQQLAVEIERFAEVRLSLSGEFKEKERLENVAEATTFIRDTLKEAAPRVARNYVYHVSLEANQMFREITGNAERTLKWAEDYSIVLEEDGFERPFISLSGGEQMSAALAVRLALLNQLSDIRIAFFDEPTANMDETRRENFAQQISRITHFDQLFVISHDETFDSYVDSVISMKH
ncbi:MAG: SMC family ATPase [Pyrinomonadaceae bacterium]